MRGKEQAISFESLERPNDNPLGYINLVREVLNLHPDQELVRREFGSGRILRPAVGLENDSIVIFPSPDIDMIFEDIAYKRQMHPNWRQHRDELDRLSQNPKEAKPLIAITWEALKLLDPLERKSLESRFQLKSEGEEAVLAWEEVAKEVGLRGKEDAKEIVQNAVWEIRQGGVFRLEMPRILEKIVILDLYRRNQYQIKEG